MRPYFNQVLALTTLDKGVHFLFEISTHPGPVYEGVASASVDLDNNIVLIHLLDGMKLDGEYRSDRIILYHQDDFDFTDPEQYNDLDALQVETLHKAVETIAAHPQIIKERGAEKQFSQLFQLVPEAARIWTSHSPTPEFSWHSYFMRIAEDVCKRSTCLCQRTGAVIVDADHRIIATGVNGAKLEGLSCCKFGMCVKGDKPCNNVSAIEDALLQARCDLTGATLYLAALSKGDVPCPGRALDEHEKNLLRHAGIKTCVVHGYFVRLY